MQYKLSLINNSETFTNQTPERFITGSLIRTLLYNDDYLVVGSLLLRLNDLRIFHRIDFNSGTAFMTIIPNEKLILTASEESVK